jgi:hypothetical protein
MLLRNHVQLSVKTEVGLKSLRRIRNGDRKGKR